MTRRELYAAATRAAEGRASDPSIRSVVAADLLAEYAAVLRILVRPFMRLALFDPTQVAAYRRLRELEDSLCIPEKDLLCPSTRSGSGTAGRS